MTADEVLKFIKDKEAENLRLRVSDPRRDGSRLFTFLEVNHMPPTNNLAEQALRLPVILRKITFGSRSLFGAQNMAINLSLLTITGELRSTVSFIPR